MAKLKTTVWDAAEYLKSDEDITAYLEAAFEDGDPALIAAALGDVARARHDADRPQGGGGARKSIQGAFERREPGIFDCADGAGAEADGGACYAPTSASS